MEEYFIEKGVRFIAVTDDIDTGNEVMTVRANVTSWRNIMIGDAFTTCLNMNRAGNP